MTATVSPTGKMVIPDAIRKQARLEAGDEVDVGFADGLVVLRKRRPLTPTRVRALLLAGRGLPPFTKADETTVARAVERVRRRCAA